MPGGGRKHGAKERIDTGLAVASKGAPPSDVGGGALQFSNPWLLRRSWLAADGKMDGWMDGWKHELALPSHNISSTSEKAGACLDKARLP